MKRPGEPRVLVHANIPTPQTIGAIFPVVLALPRLRPQPRGESFEAERVVLRLRLCRGLLWCEIKGHGSQSFLVSASGRGRAYPALCMFDTSGPWALIGDCCQRIDGRACNGF